MDWSDMLPLLTAIIGAAIVGAITLSTAVLQGKNAATAQREQVKADADKLDAQLEADRQARREQAQADREARREQAEADREALQAQWDRDDARSRQERHQAAFGQLVKALADQLQALEAATADNDERKFSQSLHDSSARLIGAIHAVSAWGFADSIDKTEARWLAGLVGTNEEANRLAPGDIHPAHDAGCLYIATALGPLTSRLEGRARPRTLVVPPD